jgi:hypothetical protein
VLRAVKNAFRLSGGHLQAFFSGNPHQILISMLNTSIQALLQGKLPKEPHQTSGKAFAARLLCPPPTAP